MSGPTQQYDWGSAGGTEPPASTRPERLPVPAHLSLDIGLLLLRLTVGGVFAAHGAQKVFGVLGGLGPQGTDAALTALGFSALASPLAWVLGVSELLFGALVVLGLFTPFAAAAPALGEDRRGDRVVGGGAAVRRARAELAGAERAARGRCRGAGVHRRRADRAGGRADLAAPPAALRLAVG